MFRSNNLKLLSNKDLWNDIIKRLISPNRQILSEVLLPRLALTSILPTSATKPFSKVINEIHAAEIASWIDNKSVIYSKTNNPYEFKLLLRGSRDGFTKDSFWNICNKQANVIVVMKVKGTDEILGGYNPIGWEKPSSDMIVKYCNNSFIFSLKNSIIRTSILCNAKEPEYAIECNREYGPIFGHKPCSLVMRDYFNEDEMCCWYYQSEYEQGLMYNEASFFSVDEYEIFQISKRSQKFNR
ncbi:hypothetical protein C2G38_2259319 [Gigaspora rosea]|uniref:TLDc domain-containing protein n=1 Tax=Gigaspora rosea TaxID=44941 RepID=A0A397UPE0_9GLOM|nr:hypothetical protein C2G38_2259319 [Gigaspora rosea]